jgi:hypothetical protein
MPEPAYQINQPIQATHQRRYRRRSLLLTVILLVFGAVTAFVIYDFYHLKHQNNKKPVGVTYEQQIAGPQTFTSSYFQFSDASKWVYAPNDSTANKLTYLLYASGLPAHSLTVYVNQTPLQDDLAVTRVLPVRLKNNNSFTIGSISVTCGSLYQPTDLKRVRTIALGGTSMLCVPDSPQFSVIVGQVGADYDLPLTRSGGEVAHYIIIYRNLTVDPDPTPFLRIMKTFKAL